MCTTGINVTLDVLLTGSSIGSGAGAFGFCGVFLITSTDALGLTRRAVVDTGHAGLREPLLERLAARDLNPADIDVVALTHAHWDHVQNVDLFPDSEIVARRELDYLAAPHGRDLATPLWTKWLFHDVRVEDITPGDQLLPGVTVVDAAGHSAGSLAFAMVVGGQMAVITGDALPNAAAAAAGQPGLVCYDLRAAELTAARLLDVGDVLYPGHDRPFRLRGEEVEYAVPHSFEIVNATADMPGLAFRAPRPHEVELRLPP